MSQEIDERVVEMRFDNKQFESGAKETMSTLSRLAEKIKMTDSAKGFEELDKAAKKVSLDGIAAGVEALQKRFSTLGIVGMRVIENLTDSITNTLGKAVGFVTDSIVSGGQRRAMNIENAHFQLQALLKDEAKVQAVMDDAMKSVDGTAYAYDEAAKAASQFAASGLEAGEEMLSALRGIVGVAAMTNSEYEGISRIFTTVAGNGRIMGDQLLQLSSRGLNAASTMADYFNKVNSGASEATDSVRAAIMELSHGQEVTEAMIRDFISDKNTNISFEIFSAAMTDAFAESAERANETFTGAFSNVKSALARIGAEFYSPLIEQNSDLIGLLNTLRVKVNAIKSAIAYDPKSSFLAGLADVSKDTYRHLPQAYWENLFDKIEERSSMIDDDISSFTSGGIPILSKLTDYLNGVTDGSIRATYALKTAVSTITDGSKTTIQDTRRMISEGLISVDILEAAMDEAYGNQRSLSHEFTEWFLDTIKNVSEKIQNIDMSKPMDIFYASVYSVKNSIVALISVMKPLASAFSEVFLSFTTTDVLNIANGLEELTSKMRLSDENSDNLKRTFRGLFSVLKLGIDVLIKVVRAFIPIKQPVDSLNNSILDFTGNVGDMLVSFTEWVRNSPNIKKAYDLVSTGIQNFMSFLAKAITKIYEFGKSVTNLPGVQKIIKSLIEAFEKIGTKISPYLDKASESLGKFTKKAGEIIPEKTNKLLESLADGIDHVFSKLSELNMETIKDGFDSAVNSVKEFFNQMNSGLPIMGSFISIKDSLTEMLREFLHFGKETNDEMDGENGIGGLKEKLSSFSKWIEKNVKPIFENFNLGSGLAIAGGLISIISTLKILNPISEGLSKIGDIPKKIVSILDSVRGTLLAYQQNLKADSLKKIATAVLILAAAIGVLSLLDTQKVFEVSIALGAASTAIVWAASKFMTALKATKTGEDALYAFANKIGKAFNKMATGVMVKLVVSSIKDIAVSVSLVVGLIAGIAYLFKSEKIDEVSVTQAVTLVGIVTVAIIDIIAALALAGDALTKGSKTFALISAGFLMLGLTVGVLVLSLNKLFKMELPANWGEKLFILGSIIAAFGVLSVALALASRKSSGSIDLSPMISMAASIYLMTFALNKLFKMELPSDWGKKLLILGTILAGYMALIAVLGVATKGDHDSLKSTGEIFSLSVVFITSITSALQKLANIDTAKLAAGVASISVILLALGASLKLMSGFQAEGMKGVIASLTILISSLVIAIGALSFIPTASLLKSVVAIGVILSLLAADFYALSRIGSGKALKENIVLMIGVILILAGSLTAMAEYPWEGLLAAGASLSMLLLAFSELLRKISSSSGIKKEKILLFAAATLALIPMALSLRILTDQPWEGLLTAGASLSLMLIAFSELLKKLSAMRGIKMEKVATFGVATLALIPIAATLRSLLQNTAGVSWESMLAAGASLSAVLLSFSVAFSIISATKPDLNSIGAFVVASASLLLVSTSIGMLAQNDWQSLVGAAVAIGAVLLSMSAAMAICSVVGVVAAQAITGLVVLGAFVAGFTGLLGVLSLISPETIEKGATTLTAVGKGIGDFFGAIVGGFAQNALEGITASFPKMEQDLSDFYTNAKAFFDGMGGLDANVFNGVKLLAETMLILVAADLIDGLFSWGTKSEEGSLFTKFGEAICEFGPYITKFAKQVSGINGNDVAQAAAATELLATVANKLPYDKDSLLGQIMSRVSLAEFGSWLVAKDENGLGFGEAIVTFSEQVKDVNADSVKGAAAAAQLMAEVANNLPYDKASLMGDLFGKISLAEFGEQLVGKDGEKGFGEAIAEFAEQVKDVKKSHVEGAAAAAQLMAEVANNLPYADDTLMSKLFGKVTLSEFAAELLLFGPSLKAFALIVNGITAEDVQGAANAAAVLSEMAENLPDGDSLIKKLFVGEKQTLSSFGEEIVSFGSALSEFSTTASGIDYDAINNTISITKELLKLLTEDNFQPTDNVDNAKIASTGLLGITAAFLENENPLGDFASTIKMLGEAIKNYYGIIENVNIETMSGVVENLNDLLDIIPLIKGLNPDDYSDKFESIGDMGLTKFISVFHGSRDKVMKAVAITTDSAIQTLEKGLPLIGKSSRSIGENLCESLQSGIMSKKALIITTVTALCNSMVSTVRSILLFSVFSQIAQNALQGLISGINSKRNSIIESVSSTCIVVIDTTKTKLDSSTFESIGVEAMNSLSSGMLAQNENLKSTANTLGDTIIASFKSKLSTETFSSIGTNISNGLGLGAESKMDNVTTSMRKVANAAIESTKNALEVRSPSRIAYAIGEFWDIGLATGILSRASDVSNAGDVTAQNVINPIRDAVGSIKTLLDSGDFDDTRFTITPILDLSDIRSGFNEMNSLFSRRLDISTNYAQVGDILDLMNQTRRSGKDTKSGTDVSKNSGPVFNFNQNNYSPKALSESEIYRQTNNQFSAFKRAVQNV